MNDIPSIVTLAVTIFVRRDRENRRRQKAVTNKDRGEEND